MDDELRINKYQSNNKWVRKLFIGTWNVRGLNYEGAYINLIEVMNDYKLDLVALQETNQRGNI